MADLDLLVRERSEGFADPYGLCRERNDELSVPSESIRDRTGEEKNTSDLGKERNIEMEASNLVADTGEEYGDASNVFRERSDVVENSTSMVGRDGENPPDDDCCPICFGGFDIPCKTNCGHWFCAGCILMFWNYSDALNCCKCPICSRLISKLTPKASLTLQREEEVVEALKKVQTYNSLFVGGAYSLIMKVLQLPMFFRRFFGRLMDPDRFRLNYYTARLISCLLTVFYEICGFDFIPTGILGVRRVFEYSAIALVLILCVVGICRKRILRRRVRLLAAPPP